MKETIKLPAQRIEAQFAAAEGNRDARTVPMTFYTGATVLQFNWKDGLHNLQLSMEPSAVNLGALKSGTAPFTMGHRDPNEPGAVIGVIENPTLSDGKAKADVRFSKRGDVEPIYQDVLDGILANVSVEARLHKLKDITKDGDSIKTFLATSWTPKAVALVSMGADKDAHINAAETVELSECEIELAEVKDETEGQLALEEKDNMVDPNTKGAEPVSADAVKAAQAAERARVLEISKMAQVAKLDATFAATHIEEGTSVEEFRKLAFEKLAERSEQNPTKGHATIERDEVDTRRALMSEAVLNSMDSKAHKVDAQNEYRHMPISRLAEECLVKAGVKVKGMSKASIADAAFSMQNTSDFAYVLENSARKRLLAAYELANPTYKLWAAPTTTPDFKTMSRVRLSEAPTLIQVAEGAQITLAQMSDKRETYALATHGRGISFTRQMLINDDLGAFNGLVSAFGAQASRLENKTVYAVLTANAALADTVALFHADHGNLGSGVIGNTGLDGMFGAMGVQKGIDGVSILNIEPKFLIVPKAKQGTALAAMTPTGPNVKATDQNYYAGRLTVVSDGELDGSSTAVWYGAADPTMYPGVEYAHLEGAEGPQMIRKENEAGVLGIQLYCYLDFAAKAVDHRPLYQSTGV